VIERNISVWASDDPENDQYDAQFPAEKQESFDIIYEVLSYG
jgi:hypothetical protein